MVGFVKKTIASTAIVLCAIFLFDNFSLASDKPRDEVEITEDSYQSQLIFPHHSYGLITIRPATRDRTLSISCTAVSTRGGQDDKWMSLNVTASPNDFIGFSKRVGVDTASRITMDEKSGTIPAGQETRIWIDHDNHFAEAVELSCVVNLE